MDGSSLRQRLFPPSVIRSPQERIRPFPVESDGCIGLEPGEHYARIPPSGQQQPGEAGRNDGRSGTFDNFDDSLQRARQGDSQRSRLIISSRFVSPKADDGPDGFSGVRPASTLPISPHLSRTLALSNGSSPNPRSPLISGLLEPPKNVPDASRFRMFSEKRPAKSLRQRLDPDEPWTQTSAGASEGPGQPYLAPQRDDMTSRAHSRSVSVLSSIHLRQEDDISSIMMRGATDLRTAKFEVDELRRENAFLQTQVESVRKEKEEISQRLKSVKDAAKQSIQASSKSLEALRSTVDDLKTRSEESFGVTRDIRASLADVQDLRSTVATAMKSIEPYLEPNEQWAKSAEVKNVMNTLQFDCSRSEQVADLLRDRLQCVGGELVEAKTRVAELEAAQSDDRATLCTANDTIRSTTAEISSLAACINEQRNELCAALSASATLEAKFNSSQEKIVELQELVCKNHTELTLLQGVQHENVRLREAIAEKDTCISSLRELQPEIDHLKDAIAKRDANVASLTALNSEKDSQILELSSRITSSELDYAEVNKKVQKLMSELATSDASGQAISRDNERLIKEKQALEVKVGDLEATIGSARQEIDDRSQKLLEANLRCQALEERFEDQSITLRLTRESAGDAQERLLEAESSHAKALAEVTAKLELDISILREQKLGVQATMEVQDAALKRQEASMLVMQQQHADQLKQQETTSAARLEVEENRLLQLTGDLKEACIRTALAEDRKKLLDDEIRELREQLHQAQLPSPEAESELLVLRSRVSTLEAAEMKSTLRAKTLDARYRVGDLNDEEKAFLKTLVQTLQAAHEQELVANRNELRRRDNALKEMRSKVHLLEMTLAKHLNEKKARPAPEPVADRSMINPDSWVSSGQSSSPVQAPDRDGLQPPSVDVPVLAKPTPKPHRTNLHTAALDDISVHVPTLPAKSPIVKDARKTVPAVPIVDKPFNKPSFTRLNTDCSDEILDYDDENSAARKLTPTSALSKRKKSSSPPRPADEPQAPRPYKRLRSTARKAEVGENGAIMAAPKPLQPARSKSKARKRR